MFLHCFGAAYSSIGCARDGDVVRAVQLAGGKTPRVHASAAEQVGSRGAVDAESSSDALQSTIGHMVERGGFGAGDVVTCLPSALVRYQRLRLASMPNDEIASAVHWKAVNELGEAPDAVRSGHYEVGEVVDGTKKRREVIAVTTQLADVHKHLSAFNSTGRSVLAIDTSTGAISRLLGAPEHHDPEFVVMIEPDHTTLMVSVAGVPRFLRTVPFGADRVAARAASAVNAGAPQSVTSGASSINGPANEESGSGDRALSLFAGELGQEITRCVHYLNDLRPLDLAPAKGCVVSSSLPEQRVSDELNRSQELVFVPLGSALPTQFASVLHCLAPGGEITPWLVPLGLALYGHERRLVGAAA